MKAGRLLSRQPTSARQADLAIHREGIPLYALARSITLTMLAALAIAGATDRYVVNEPEATLGLAEARDRSTGTGSGNQSISSIDLPEQVAAPRLGQRLAPTRDPGDTRRLESVLPGTDSYFSKSRGAVSFATNGLGSRPAHGFAHRGLLQRAGSLSSFSTSLPPPHSRG